MEVVMEVTPRTTALRKLGLLGGACVGLKLVWHSWALEQELAGARQLAELFWMQGSKLGDSCQRSRAVVSTISDRSQTLMVRELRKETGPGGALMSQTSRDRGMLASP